MSPTTIACFKWKYHRGLKTCLPTAISEYTGMHVNILHNMLWRNIKMPFRFVCITDDSTGIDPRIETIPLWDKYIALGGCYNRLFVFSKDMLSVLGSRFACIDLDCVIVDDVTHIFNNQEDFIINSYKPHNTKLACKSQMYNGGLMIMNAGCRSKVWESFNPKESPELIQKSKDTVGTDQAWIRHVLGPDEKTFTEKDGVYEARFFSNRIPDNARIIFFAGQRDPSLLNYSWIKDNWR